MSPRDDVRNTYQTNRGISTLVEYTNSYKILLIVDCWIVGGSLVKSENALRFLDKVGLFRDFPTGKSAARNAWRIDGRQAAASRVGRAQATPHFWKARDFIAINGFVFDFRANLHVILKKAERALLKNLDASVAALSTLTSRMTREGVSRDKNP